MNTIPIPADILARHNGQVSRPIDGLSRGELIFGFTAEKAALAVEFGPHNVAGAILRGDLEYAREAAQRIALARDALPTQAERRAVPYREYLARALAT